MARKRKFQAGPVADFIDLTSPSPPRRHERSRSPSVVVINSSSPTSAPRSRQRSPGQEAEEPPRKRRAVASGSGSGGPGSDGEGGESTPVAVDVHSATQTSPKLASSSIPLPTAPITDETTMSRERRRDQQRVAELEGRRSGQKWELRDGIMWLVNADGSPLTQRQLEDYQELRTLRKRNQSRRKREKRTREKHLREEKLKEVKGGPAEQEPGPGTGTNAGPLGPAIALARDESGQQDKGKEREMKQITTSVRAVERNDNYKERRRTKKDSPKPFFVDDTPGPVPSDLTAALPAPAFSQPDDNSTNLHFYRAHEVDGLLLPSHIRVSTGEASEEEEVEEDLLKATGSEATTISDEEGPVIVDLLPGGQMAPNRYYDAEKAKAAQDELQCTQCMEKGHHARACPHMVCFSCGAVDQHDTRKCTAGSICFNCSKRGHQISDCPEPRKRIAARCEKCGAPFHRAINCPSIWRTYVYYTRAEKEAREGEARKSKISILEGGTIECGEGSCCSWCGNPGHWVDDCPLYFSRQPSAFSWYNALSGPFGDAPGPGIDFSQTYGYDERDGVDDHDTPGLKAREKQKEKGRQLAAQQDDEDTFFDEIQQFRRREPPDRPRPPTGPRTMGVVLGSQNDRHTRFDHPLPKRPPTGSSMPAGRRNDYRDREEPRSRRDDDYRNGRYAGKREREYNRRGRDDDDDYYDSRDRAGGSSRQQGAPGQRYHGGYSR